MKFREGCDLEADLYVTHVVYAYCVVPVGVDYCADKVHTMAVNCIKEDC